jgi:hypothetical protein
MPSLLRNTLTPYDKLRATPNPSPFMGEGSRSRQLLNLSLLVDRPLDFLEGFFLKTSNIANNSKSELATT